MGEKRNGTTPQEPPDPPPFDPDPDLVTFLGRGKKPTREELLEQTEGGSVGMKRALTSLVIGYVVLALLGKAREAAGLISCDCDPDCWCRRPGLSLFRWVFPRFHRDRALEAWKKERFASPE